MSTAFNYIVIDQGTSSTKAFLFDSNGNILHSKKSKHTLIRPKPFHVECDADGILNACRFLFDEMMLASGNIPVKKVGLAVQRSTFLFWEKEICKPATSALSWQDSRAHAITDELSEHEDQLWDITGTPLSAHFGGPKYLHLTRHNPELMKKVKKGELYFGSLSAFLSQAMTGTPGIDDSIACRSLFYDIHQCTWSNWALDLFQVDKQILPPLVSVQHNFGNVFNSGIPLTCVIGDQQGALIGQAGLVPGNIAANFGTSGSVQFNVGEKPTVMDGLISSVLFSNNIKKIFMVEGTINACNSLFYHLEDMLDIPHEKLKWHKRIKDTKTEGIFIPGFAGLASPYWEPGSDDILINLNINEKDEIVRAGMESIGFLVNDIISRLLPIIGKKPEVLTTSGGGARDPLLQFIADLTGIKVGHSAMKDRTAFGVFKILSQNFDFEPCPNIDHFLTPDKNVKIEKKKMQWQKAINQAISI